MPFYTLNVPIRGNFLFRVEAPTKEAALAMVLHEDYELPTDEESEGHHGGAQCLGYAKDEVSLLMEGPLREMWVVTMGDDNNHDDE